MILPEIDLKVRGILAAKLGIDAGAITGDSRLAEDLGVDSFGAVELMFEIEEAFGLTIPDSDIGKVRSVGDIVAYLDSWINRPAAEREPVG
jgi:acyl carrier protein